MSDTQHSGPAEPPKTSAPPAAGTGGSGADGSGEVRSMWGRLAGAANHYSTLITLIGALGAAIGFLIAFRTELSDLGAKHDAMLVRAAALETDVRTLKAQVAALETTTTERLAELSKVDRVVQGQIAMLDGRGINTSTLLDEFCQKTRDFAADIDGISRAFLQVEIAYSDALDAARRSPQSGGTLLFGDRFLGKIGQMLSQIGASFGNMDRKYRDEATMMTVCKPDFLFTNVSIPPPTPAVQGSR